jgi:hypothetical protein
MLYETSMLKSIYPAKEIEDSTPPIKIINKVS